MDELKAVSEVTRPDIICIVETLLTNEINDVEVNLPDYQLLRLDRCGRGGLRGGIAIYVRTFLSCKVLFQGGPFSLEFLSVSITCQPFCTFCLCLFYCPPSSPVSIFDHFCTTANFKSSQISSFCNHW